MNPVLSHPDAKQLTDFGLGQLDEVAAEDVEGHLAACERCRRVVEDLPADPIMQLLQTSYARSDADGLYPEPPPAEDLPSEDSPPPRQELAPAYDGRAVRAELPAMHVPEGLAEHPRYRVLHELGSGGMGTVYKARHLLMDRLVALKVMSPELLSKPKATERFTQEVKTAAKLSHPNIVTAHDAETVTGLHFLVMEFVEGQTLAKIVEERGVLPVARACEYVRQAALGLQHAHERGMVHRDIKPQNLMLAASPVASAPGVIKILDFGLARFLSESERTAGGTEFGALMGSPDYIAPEQARDARRADIRADIYGLGCTFYFLLAGQPPFADGTTADKLAGHLERTPPAVTVARPDVPEGLARVLERMLAKNPAERYQTPADVAVAVEPYCLGKSASPQPPRRRPLLGRRIAAWAAAAVVLLGLTGAGFTYGPAVMRIATNRGVLVIETDDPDVEIVVKEGGEQVRVIEPRSGQEITLKAGTYQLELTKGPDGLKLETREFALRRGGKQVVRVYLDKPAVAAAAPRKEEPRPPEPRKEEPKKDDPPRDVSRPAIPAPDPRWGVTARRAFEVGGTRLSYAVSLLQDPAVHRELRLTPEQKTKLAPLTKPSDGFAGQGRSIDGPTLQALLTPEQVQRLRELQLRQLQNSQNVYGPAHLYRYHEVTDSLALSSEQQRRLQQLVDEDAKAYADITANGASREEKAARIKEQTAALEKNLEDFLTAEQKAKKADVLGKPFQFATNTFRSFEVGSTALTYLSTLVDAPSVQRELGLSEEQRIRLAAVRSGGPTPSRSIPEQHLAAILRPEQLGRLRELRLQQLDNPRNATGANVRNLAGASVLYRYRVFVDGLGLSDEQREQLQLIVIEYARVSPASLSQPSQAQDDQFRKQVDAVLTDVQKAKRAEVVGKPFDFSTLPNRGKVRTLNGRAAADIRLAAGRKLLGEKKFAEALSEGNEALRIVAGLAEAYRLRGDIYSAQQEFARAVAEYTQEISHNPKDPASAYWLRAGCYLQLAAYESCIRDSTEAVRLNPEAIGAIQNRGWAHACQGNYEQALADHDEVVRRQPKNANALFSRSGILARLGETARAKADRDAAVALDPAVVQWWSGFPERALLMPAPLSYWLRGRHVLQVAQDGKAPFKSIGDALKAIKPGEVIEVLDKGPYRERLVMTSPVADIGLISRVGTRVEIPSWHNKGPAHWHPGRNVYQGCLLLSPNGLRLSGLVFVCPPAPADAAALVGVHVETAGEVVVEGCRVYQTPRFERPPAPGLTIALVVGWQGAGPAGTARYLVQHNLLDGQLQFKQDIPSRTVVQYNLIRAAESHGLQLPPRGGEVIVRHNVIQARGGMVFLAREEPKVDTAPAEWLIHNNLIEAGGTPVWATAADAKNPLPLWRNVRIQNNVLRSQSGTGIELPPDDHKPALATWRLGHNCYSTDPKPVPGNFPHLPKQPTDVVLASQFLSVDPNDPQYLRIAADGPLATAGAGGDLPAYIGPFPPGPAPKDGDWFTPLRQP